MWFKNCIFPSNLYVTICTYCVEQSFMWFIKCLVPSNLDVTKRKFCAEQSIMWFIKCPVQSNLNVINCTCCCTPEWWILWWWMDGWMHCYYRRMSEMLPYLLSQKILYRFGWLMLFLSGKNTDQWIEKLIILKFGNIDTISTCLILFKKILRFNFYFLILIRTIDDLFNCIMLISNFYIYM
jgi:hypothetical protein